MQCERANQQYPYAMLKYLHLILSLCLLLSCTSHESSQVAPMQYARLLSIEQADSFALVRIADPWHQGRTLVSYVLVPDSLPLPHHLPQGNVIRTPLKRAVVTSSVHAALLMDLNAAQQMVGVTDVNYIVSERIRQYLKAHVEVKNMGATLTPDIELYKAVQADAVLVSPFEGADYGVLRHSGIPLIECADYMETSPLGRAEWMRFYGLLFGKATQADSLFALTAERYEALKQMVVKQGSEHPKVMCDLRVGSTWYQPGGASTMGQFIADAGGDYLWADRPESGSLALDLESVYARAHKADIWLVKYGQTNDLTYEQMQRDCSQYAHFKPWQQRHVFACNTYRLPFYEEVPFQPDRLLRNLIDLFKTAKVDNAEPYYTPLK